MLRLKGKPLSLSSKLVAVLLVFTAILAEIITGKTLPINDVIKAAIFIMLVFAPVDISLWMETFLSAFARYKNHIKGVEH